MHQLKHVKGLYAIVDTAGVGYDNWKTYIDSFLLNCQVKNLSDSTINNYTERLGYLARFLIGKQVDIEACTRTEITEYIVSLAGRVSVATVNGRIQCYRTFWKYLVEEGLWTLPNPTERLKKQRAPRCIKPILSEEDIARALAATPGRDFVTMRNRVMLLMFFDTMIRRNELLTLTLEKVDLKNGILKVWGKGSREREVPMGAKMIKALHFYLARFRSSIPGKLVFSTRDGHALDKDNARQIIWRMGQKVGIHLTPHLIRHSACTWFIRHGGSPAIAQRIMGHTSPVITDRYTHLNSQDMVDSYQRLSPANAIKM
jgi:integrase/recombinase XerD